MLPGNIIKRDEPAAMQINLVMLPKAYRQPVWEWMQKHRPAVCEWLGGDQCKMMRAMMDAAPVLDLNTTEAEALLKQLPGLARYAT